MRGMGLVWTMQFISAAHLNLVQAASNTSLRVAWAFMDLKGRGHTVSPRPAPRPPYASVSASQLRALSRLSKARKTATLASAHLTQPERRIGTLLPTRTGTRRATRMFPCGGSRTSSLRRLRSTLAA
ncbi:hypothetical protein B0H11DRAFT_1352692 [Mycena galericulata]|nr:hypothetical protein B0H11DRAFT_1352692 [Mycena galericulata]